MDVSNIEYSVVDLFLNGERIGLGLEFTTDTFVGIIVGILFAILGIWLYNVLEKEVKKKRENK